jgi:hypothetical protein
VGVADREDSADSEGFADGDRDEVFAEDVRFDPPDEARRGDSSDEVRRARRFSALA